MCGDLAIIAISHNLVIPGNQSVFGSERLFLARFELDQHPSCSFPGSLCCADLITKYSHLFQGIDKIEDKNIGSEILGRLDMRPEAVPVAQKPRQVPYFLQEPLKKKWLEQGVNEDIFQNVPDDEPITWCSPKVVQPKPKFAGTLPDKLESHMIRASVDLRVPNKNTERSRIAQAPIVEDFIHKFHHCTIWTKLDLRQGDH